jgi:3-hydroxyisobutyrate dehydrogenase-like beta-hydroxyacid dehydrogenase
MGLEDSRTVHVARQLLKKGVSVRVWAKDQLSKDLEYSNAERVNDGEKLFEEADVVLLSAAGNHELQALLGGVDHTLRKIRPAGKNKFKGVCVFSTLTKHERYKVAKCLTEFRRIRYI